MRIHTSCAQPCATALLFNPAGISHYDLTKPGVPTQAAALQALSQFINTHTAQHAGAVPLLVAHNGYAFDFRALAVAVHRQQQQALQQQQRQQTGLLAFWKSSSSSSNGVQMPEHLMVLDTLVLARRLELKRAAGLSNLQQGGSVRLCARSLASCAHILPS